MQKEKFITVMAILDEDTQAVLHEIQDEFNRLYGEDIFTTKQYEGDELITPLPFHISLGSYAPEEKDNIISRMKRVAKETAPFPVKLNGYNHFGEKIRFVAPQKDEKLLSLRKLFDADYAGSFPEWVPHITVYIHEEPSKLELPPHLLTKLETIKNPQIVGLELGEFFPEKKIIRVIFEK